jgi:hypothetical protein
MSPLQNCVLCNQTVKEYERQASSTIYYVRCDVCGKYKSESYNDEVHFSKLPIEDRAMLSAYTRELYEYEAPIPELYTLDDEEKIERIIERFRRKTVIEKLNNLILYLGKRSHYFKEPLRIHGEKDYPITYSVNKIEFDNIRGQADAAKLVSLPISGGNVQLEWAGWERFEAIKNAGVLSKRCFVAMSCSSDLTGAYEHGIKPAVKEAGYDPIFIEREEHNEKICDLIIAEIRSCKFVIADVTGQRQNVYYEAGFAHGLGRDVIWTCRRDERDNTHFDTRQYNHIFWENEEDLKKKLVNRIKATIL